MGKIFFIVDLFATTFIPSYPSHLEETFFWEMNKNAQIG